MSAAPTGDATLGQRRPFPAGAGPEADRVRGQLRELYRRHAGAATDGGVSFYPPEAEARRETFGLSGVHVSGARVSLGDCRERFPLHSISKVFTYALALEDNGREATLTQPLVVLGDHGHRGGVDGVGLAGVSGVQQPSPGGELGGDIDHRLAGAGQTLGDAATESGRAFDRPSALWPATGPRQQPGHALGGDLEADRAGDLAACGQSHRGQRGLVRVDPDRDHEPPSVASCGEPRGGQPDFRSVHASVEPHRGRVTTSGTLCESQSQRGGKKHPSQPAITLGTLWLQTQRPGTYPTSQKHPRTTGQPPRPSWRWPSKLLEAAETRWRAVNGPHLVPLVRAGATFEKGVLVERPTEAVNP